MSISGWTRGRCSVAAFASRGGAGGSGSSTAEVLNALMRRNQQIPEMPFSHPAMTTETGYAAIKAEVVKKGVIDSDPGSLPRCDPRARLVGRRE